MELKCSVSRSSVRVDLRIERVAQAVAEKIEGEHREEDGDDGEDRRMRRRHEVGAGLVEHRAPFGHRRLRAESEEGERRRRDDRSTDAHREVDEDDGDRPGEDVPHEQHRLTDAEALRCLDVGLGLQGKHARAHESGEGRNRKNRHGRNDVRESAAQNRHGAAALIAGALQPVQGHRRRFKERSLLKAHIFTEFYRIFLRNQ